MSWIEWLGEKLPGEAGVDARLRVHVWPPESVCPRVSWSMDLRYHLWRQNMPEGKRKIDGWLSIEIGDLGFHGRDWRDLEGMEIRADAAWQSAHEYFGEYGNLNTGQVMLMGSEFPNTPRNPKAKMSEVHWLGTDFVLKLGRREGFIFPMELDAWMLPEKEFYRSQPESESELAVFGEGPPDLRLLARAAFVGGIVEVPRCDDPLPLAARILREEVSLETMHEPAIEWSYRRDYKTGKSVQFPGGTSRVNFKTSAPPTLSEEEDAGDDIPF
jgi:hypothetical protein